MTDISLRPRAIEGLRSAPKKYRIALSEVIDILGFIW